MHKFVPKEHLPNLPHSTECNQEGSDYHDYVRTAWHAYWTWVHRTKDRLGCDMEEAREWVHSRGKMPEVTDSEFPYWDTDDILVAFMQQFPGWQQRGYNLAVLQAEHMDHRSVGDGTFIDWYAVGKKKETPFLLFLVLLSYEERGNLVSFLMAANRIEDMKMLANDPIYGPEVCFEMRMREASLSHEADEVFRRAVLPEPLMRIQLLLDKVETTIYDLMYPWDKMQHTLGGYKQIHDIENCVTVLGDGGLIFRLGVIDTEGFTKFTMGEMAKPWWSLHGGFGETDPNSAEYDFPFSDFGIQEGDELDYDNLLKVIEEGLVRMATRGERKFSHRDGLDQENDISEIG